MAREITEEDRLIGQSIWEVARTSFPSKGALAKQLGVSAQYLNAYLSGTNRPGIVFLKKLADAGVDITKIKGTEELRNFAVRDASIPAIHAGAIRLLGKRRLEEIAKTVEATPREIEDWDLGKQQPNHRQLALLFNELYKAAAAISQFPQASPAGKGTRLRQGNDI